MPTANRIIWNGTPGERWVNDQERVKYQFVCALINTCGFCLQYHMAIGAWWGIPLHYGCRCTQKAIKPGGEAPNAFVDFREILDGMPHDQQVAAIGASNYKLLKTGVIEWKDVVTPGRVRDLREVVANKRLSVKTLTDAGVRPTIAEAAHKAVHTAEHELVAAHRRELTEKITAAGLNQEQLAAQLAKGLVEKVSLGAGPDTYGQGPAWGPSKPWFGPGTGPSHAAALTALLAAPRPRRTGEVGPAERTVGAPTMATDGVITIRTNERTITIRPGESALGKTYEEWVKGTKATLRTSAEPEWKPSMSAADAETWAKDSAVKDEFFHVTTRDAAESIRRGGFRLDIGEHSGRVWGDGVYLGIGEDEKAFYAGTRSNPTTLKIKVDVKKVLEFDATGEAPGQSAVGILVDKLGKRAEFRKITTAANAKNDAVLREFLRARRDDPKAFAGDAGNEWLAKRGYVADPLQIDRDTLTQLLRAEGYDAVRIKQTGGTIGFIGGNQLVVLDPKKVVVIDD